MFGTEVLLCMWVASDLAGVFRGSEDASTRGVGQDMVTRRGATLGRSWVG